MCSADLIQMGVFGMSHSALDGATAAKSPTVAQRVWNATKEGAKAVAADYGLKGAAQTAAGAVAGAYAGTSAVTYVGTNLAVRGGAKAVVKGALAGSGIGSAVTLIPDAWTFGKAFIRAYNSYS